MIPNLVLPKFLDPCHGRTRLYGPEWPDPPHQEVDNLFKCPGITYRDVIEIIGFDSTAIGRGLFYSEILGGDRSTTVRDYVTIHFNTRKSEGQWGLSVWAATNLLPRKVQSLYDISERDVVSTIYTWAIKQTHIDIGFRHL